MQHHLVHKPIFCVQSQNMKPKKRQKLCHNCEGGIDLDVIVCPYCAADLRIEKTLQPKAAPAQVVPPLYPQAQEPIEETQEAAPIQQSNPSLVPHLLLASGAQIFMLGLLLILFSHDGTLVLKWNARYWVFYIAASLPLLIFGYRSLLKNA